MQIRILVAAAVMATMTFAPLMARAQAALTGEPKLACTAILCLASPTRPDECAGAVARYFSISLRSFAKTVTARKNFLALCPQVEPSLVQDIVNVHPPAPDPVQPDPVLRPDPVIPLTRSEIEARIAELVPIYQAQVAISVAAFKVVDECVKRNGRVQDGFCGPEVADFNVKRGPAGVTRDEIYRLEALLANFK